MGILPPIEPTSNTRSSAKQLRSIYLAFIEAGFSEEESFALLLKVMEVSAE
jgi:hypothetical protein